MRAKLDKHEKAVKVLREASGKADSALVQLASRSPFYSSREINGEVFRRCSFAHNTMNELRIALATVDEMMGE